MISQSYIDQNKRLHNTNEHYGAGGARWADKVYELCSVLKTRDVLDYGCGKGTLQARLPFIRGYDPAVPGHDSVPHPADIVVCTDVLEHIEPEYLDQVLGDLQRCTKRTLFASIHTAPAIKTLPDGRNAHLIQQGQSWWIPKIMARFHIRTFIDYGHEITILADAIPAASERAA